MKRIGLLALGAAIALPATAQAQMKPSGSMHTRSAEVYLKDATSSPQDRNLLLQRAIEVLKEGDKENPRVWFLMGQAYAMLQDVVGADTAFDHAQALYPEYEAEIAPYREAVWAGMYNAGVASLQAGAMDEAIERFEAADRIFRGRPEALMTLGPLYARQQELAKAEAAYRAALEIIDAAPDDMDAEVAAEWAQLRQEAVTEIGALLAAQGKKTEAVALYREILAKDPQNATAKAELALALSESGQTDEAAALYNELLNQSGIDEATLFNIGVGLYRAEQYERAAEAFRSALERNPWSNETRYNLGQAIYAHTAKLENDPANVAATKAAYAELLEVAKALAAADPNNRNAWMMVAQAQRSLSDVTEGAESQRMREEVVKSLETAEGLAFEVTGVSMRPTETGVRVSGEIVNRKLQAGAPVRLRISLVDLSGATVATGEAQVAAGAAEESVEFVADIPTDKAVAGWKYEPIG